MEIQSLRLLVTDADLAGLVQRGLADQPGLEGVRASILPEGVKLAGEYPTGFGFKVPFETVWALTGEGPCVRARLDSVKVAGMPAGMLRGALMRAVRDNAEGHPGVSIDGESVLVDVPAAAAKSGVELCVTFTAVRPAEGSLIVEVG